MIFSSRKIVMVLIYLGILLESIFVLLMEEGTIFSFSALVAIFAITAIALTLKGGTVIDLVESYRQKFPLFSKTFGLVYKIFIIWIGIFAYLLFFIGVSDKIYNRYFFDREACIKDYLIMSIPSVDTNAYVKDIDTGGRLYPSNRLEQIAIFANRDIKEIREIAKNELEKYVNKGIKYDDKVTKVADLTNETKEEILQNIDKATEERADITRVLNICVNNTESDFVKEFENRYKIKD